MRKAKAAKQAKTTTTTTSSVAASARKKKQQHNEQKQAVVIARKQRQQQEEESLDNNSHDGGDGDDDYVYSSVEEQREKDQVVKQNLDSDDDDDDDDSDSDTHSSSDDSSSSSDDQQDELNPFFTDENAGWLEPKTKKKQEQNQKASELLSSSDEEESGDQNDDDDDDNDNDSDSNDDESDQDEEEELLEIEKEARLIDEEMEVEQQEAEEEMQRTVRQHTSIYHLPTKEELEKDADRVVLPSEIRLHIETILEVLADFKTRREPGRARKEYIAQLGEFIAELNGYLPELVEYFLTMFGPAETVEFVNASDKPRPLVIRTNTLKTRRKDLAASLIKRGVSLDPLASWSKVGLKIVESPVPIGATPEYLSGMYMLQSAASMCPVLALAPEPKERVLDMSAAPGGKTSYMAQLMRNTGYILANDLKLERQKATVANMHRLGVKNVIACTYDGRKIGSLFHNRFDRILLDAPCSGLGVISRDPSVKVQRTMADVQRTAHLQKELLLSAIDALKPYKKNGSPGILVYSTCSISVAENEQVVQYALSKRDIRVVDAGLDFGKAGFTRYQERRFHPSMALTRRFYPHVHNMDGFFVAKIIKLSDHRPDNSKNTGAEEDQENEQDVTTAVTNDDPNDDDDDEDDDELRKKKKTAKRKERPFSGDHDEANDLANNSKKSKKVSVPPRQTQQGKQKKSKTNAKVSKPRRFKPGKEA